MEHMIPVFDHAHHVVRGEEALALSEAETMITVLLILVAIKQETFCALVTGPRLTTATTPRMLTTEEFLAVCTVHLAELTKLRIAEMTLKTPRERLQATFTRCVLLVSLHF